jgi:hypothetical protein
MLDAAASDVKVLVAVDRGSRVGVGDGVGVYVVVSLGCGNVGVSGCDVLVDGGGLVGERVALSDGVCAGGDVAVGCKTGAVLVGNGAPVAVGENDTIVGDGRTACDETLQICSKVITGGWAPAPTAPNPQTQPSTSPDLTV